MSLLHPQLRVLYHRALSSACVFTRTFVTTAATNRNETNLQPISLLQRRLMAAVSCHSTNPLEARTVVKGSNEWIHATFVGQDGVKDDRRCIVYIAPKTKKKAHV